MKRVILVLVGVFLIFFGVVYYFISNIHFSGREDPKDMLEYNKYIDDMLLSAEYRKYTDYCSIELLDSINAQINTGNNAYSIIVPKEYIINNDTIIFKKDVYPNETGELAKYVDAEKYLLRIRLFMF